MRSLLCLSLLLLPLTALCAQTESAIPSTVELTVGTQRVLTIPRLLKLAVGNVDIADVKTLGNNEVLLIGAGEGETTLRVWQKGSPDRVDIKLLVAAGIPAAARPAAAKVDTRTAHPVGAETELTLKIGEERILAFPGITRVAVGDADILDVKTLGNDRLLLKAGKQVAGTSLLVWSGEPRREFLVHVVK